MKINELRKVAGDLGIPGYDSLKKPELLAAIELEMAKDKQYVFSVEENRWVLADFVHEEIEFVSEIDTPLYNQKAVLNTSDDIIPNIAQAYDLTGSLPITDEIIKEGEKLRGANGTD